MYAIPNGLSILPSMPDRKNSGKKATMIIKVAFNMDDLISLDASRTTVKADCRSFFGSL